MAGDAYPRPEGMTRLTRALDRPDAFILVTSEYNHSYPASLKAAIDWHFTQWQAKPVALVSYGGAAGGRHAVLHLENVLTELHAVTIRGRLSFPNTSSVSKTAIPSTPKQPSTPKSCSNSSYGGRRSSAKPAPKTSILAETTRCPRPPD